MHILDRDQKKVMCMIELLMKKAISIDLQPESKIA